ncbi:MAG: DNA repair protein [Flavobacteriaceae bacterium CG18_big_fil_WC_8_21_14_2_50_34_36]|nr:JAB domain-containing protein [Flavobacteriia bacterium]NCT18043.1 JAB domain-containing protein [Flavobacteriia bacterium]PIQ17200.1 MAG: DNA repair protein [Flavobacteriaceae bacterium CG18_big_fil_WC_8_21_14_2_50_34_36]PJC08206.1 MAG: DNA repair protein [Flavobacteriaceae bacterium CG_4_9_14_0_8_um_filter_34_30]
MKTKQLTTHLMSCSEIELYFKRPLFNSMISITQPEDAVKVLRQYLNPKTLDLREVFWLLTLTNSNRLISVSEVTTGTSKGVQISHKLILQLALKTNASAIIVAHNHPSGTLKISEGDRRETNKLKTLSNLMEITLLDHLIITSESYLSFAYEREL